MISINVRAALRRRLTDPRHSENQDGGFALIITMIVVLLVTTAVAIGFSAVAPAMSGANSDQATKAATQAAMAGIDDFLALASTTTQNGCRTSDCPYLLGTTSSATNRTMTIGTSGETFSWSSASAPNPDYSIRVQSTGTAPNGTTATLTADVALTNPFLAYGYYSDFESQASSYIYSSQPARTIYVNATAASYMGPANSYSAPTTINWTAPGGGTGGQSPSVCDLHYYDETINGKLVKGRGNVGSTWSRTATIGTNTSKTYPYPSTCDVVFTTGMNFNGPVYTRDAIYISDGTANGAGPMFQQPVTTLWGATIGSTTYNSPAPTNSSQPWRVPPSDTNISGNVAPGSQSPSNSGATDLQLPLAVSTSDLPPSSCVYYGPTRVVLNNNGTASIISPYTTAPVQGADPRCYPAGNSFAGVGTSAATAVTVNYGADVGNSTIVVHNSGSVPSTGWPTTGQKLTSSPSPSNTVFYLANNGAIVSPDQTDSSTALSSGCSTSAGYNSAANNGCAWSDVSLSGTSNNDAAPGWASYSSSSKCNQFSTTTGTDRQQFECEYSSTTGNNLPPTNQYGALRAAIQNALVTNGSPTCPSYNGATAVATATQQSCIVNVINAALKQANTTQAAAVTTPTAANQRQYVAAPVSGAGGTGTAVTGSSQTVSGSAAPAAPAASDPLFTSTSSGAQEAQTGTPLSFTVSRQVSASAGSGTYAWNSGVAQFTVTVTQNHWAITQPAQGLSYFPSMQDVTQYSQDVSSTNAPGDVYIQGNNQGRLSVVADNDIIVTGDIVDTSSNPANDAVDLIANNNVRDYHPVKCADTNASDINSTTAGWCPNDINGMYNSANTNNTSLTSASAQYNSSDGFLPQHPAIQYVNLPMPYTQPNGTLGTTTAADPFPSSNSSTSCPSSSNSTSYSPSDCREIDAAVFALTGSLLTDNFNRGFPLGSLAIDGGIYQSHRGANGIQWEPTTGKRPSSGANLQYNYINLQRRGLPFIPASTTNSTNRPWAIESISNGSGS